MWHADLFGPLVLAAVLVVPLWRIFGRAGFSPAWSLLGFLPGVGFLAIILLLAFGRWRTGPPAAGQ